MFLFNEEGLGYLERVDLRLFSFLFEDFSRLEGDVWVVGETGAQGSERGTHRLRCTVETGRGHTGERAVDGAFFTKVSGHSEFFLQIRGWQGDEQTR